MEFFQAPLGIELPYCVYVLNVYRVLSITIEIGFLHTYVCQIRMVNGQARCFDVRWRPSLFLAVGV
jgi:hypothetical protein